MLEVFKSLRNSKLRVSLAVRKMLQTLREELIVAPIEPILHLSPLRMKLAGLSFLVGHTLFSWIWSVWLPQPYENVALRILASTLGLSLIWVTYRVGNDPTSQLPNRIFTLVYWLNLPVLFTWMYLCNSGSTMWLGTMAVMVVAYYQLTDWRLASLGTVTGILSAWCLFVIIAPDVPAVPEDQGTVNAVVFAFAWFIGLALSLSSANLRRAYIKSTMATMGIMAHELRTPLSAADLLGDAIHMVAERRPDHPAAPQLVKLGGRLRGLVRTMNHQIDMQIANARLLQLPTNFEMVDAAKTVSDAVAAYPFPSEREKRCVKVTVHAKFVFRSSTAQFSQVLDNLIKNALRSLMAADSEYQEGALSIEVMRQDKRGQVVVTDMGGGIDPALLPHIFKPFFSTHAGTGHGLGLAFCKQVIERAGGTIFAKSQIAKGASFMIEVPVEE